jgi:hypothetical protein
MGEINNYLGIRPETVGINLTEAQQGELWRTGEDNKRILEYQKNDNLYIGNHCNTEGGPFLHFYAGKAKDHAIPYLQANILAKGTRAYADLINAQKVTFSSNNEFVENLLCSLDWCGLWEALIQASKFGFVGICPSKDNLKARRGQENLVVSEWGFMVITPDRLYPKFNPSTGKLENLRKCIQFEEIDTDIGIIDILFEETHYKDRVETRLYKISGDNIISQIPNEYYLYIDPNSGHIPEVWQHNLGDFFITLIYNERIGNEAFSDYTETALKLQQSLNNRLTQIDRILGVHADPRLIAPLSSLKKDEESGEWDFVYQGQEIIFYDDKSPVTDPYKLLTWGGELTQAVSNRDNLILSLLTEFDLAPQLTSYSNLFTATVADTASKMEKMLESTLKRANRKRDNLKEALYLLCDNILRLQNIQDLNYTVEFPETITQNREEVINEQITLKQANLTTTKDAIKQIDELSEEEAQTKMVEIMNEQSNAVKNPFQEPSKWLTSEEY